MLLAPGRFSREKDHVQQVQEPDANAFPLPPNYNSSLHVNGWVFLKKKGGLSLGAFQSVLGNILTFQKNSWLAGNAKHVTI